MDAVQVQDIALISLKQLVVIANRLGLVGPAKQVFFHLVKAQKITGAVIGEPDAHGVHQWEDHKNAHTGDRRKYVTMRIELPADKHCHGRGSQYQKQHGEHKFALGVQRQDQVERRYQQCRQRAPLQEYSCHGVSAISRGGRQGFRYHCSQPVGCRRLGATASSLRVRHDRPGRRYPATAQSQAISG